MSLNPASIAVLFLLAAPALRAQTPAPDLPSAPTQPAAPAKPDFSLPSRPVLQSSGTPPSTPDQPEECYAPATGLYAPQPKRSPAEQEAIARYGIVAETRMGTVFDRHMPRAVNDPWIKKASVTIRFAIFPDGSIDTPIITISSGRRDYDHHALDAVHEASPFDPLPKGVTKPIPICMRFGYNVDFNRHPAQPAWDAPPPKP